MIPVGRPHVCEHDLELRWTADGRGFFFYRAPENIRYEVYRLDLASGERQRIRTLSLPEGSWANGGVLTTGDGERFVYTYQQGRAILYLADGLIAG